MGEKRPGGKRLGGKTTRGGNGLGAKRPGFFLHNLYHMFKALVGKCFINLEIERTYKIKNFIKFVYLKLISLPTNVVC